ncbi:hypothetical protein B0H14DRAFT_2634857 [Mycena olivaceomarginata]|nr:hypothetical protein B0H14DRAFT_2634857 [Mycena olivaceomarginata]
MGRARGQAVLSVTVIMRVTIITPALPKCRTRSPLDGHFVQSGTAGVAFGSTTRTLGLICVRIVNLGRHGDGSGGVHKHKRANERKSIGSTPPIRSARSSPSKRTTSVISEKVRGTVYFTAQHDDGGQLIVKWGESACLARRQLKYDECGVGQTQMWFGVFEVGRRLLAERVIRLALIGEGYTRFRFEEPCSCGRCHREYHWMRPGGSLEEIEIIARECLAIIEEPTIIRTIAYSAVLNGIGPTPENRSPPEANICARRGRGGRASRDVEEWRPGSRNSLSLKVAWSRSVEIEQKDLVCTTETSHRPSAVLEKAATTERKCSVVAGLCGGTLFGASAVESISTRSSLPSALFGVSAVERAVCEPEAREFSKISASTAPRRRTKCNPAPLSSNEPLSCITKSPKCPTPPGPATYCAYGSLLLDLTLRKNTASPRKTRTTESWTKISDRQVKTAGELSLNDSWSIEQKLAVDLIDAVSLDLDILLPPHPKLASSLEKVITTLEEQWNKHFEDNSRWRPSNTPGLESVTERATNILFEAVADAWSHIQAIQPTEPQQIEIEEGCYIAVWEDKRPHGFTSVLVNLSQRAGHGAFNSDISSALSVDFVQRPWWILANKGLFYVGLYGVNWIIFSGVTGFCVGHRMNKHMFWSGPVYNRRDKGQELVDETPDGIYTFFGDAPHPNKRQIDVFLLFLAVVLRGAYDKGNSPWVKTLFAKLCALSFTPPSTEIPHRCRRSPPLVKMLMLLLSQTTTTSPATTQMIMITRQVPATGHRQLVW